jgi:hypothetical protein
VQHAGGLADHDGIPVRVTHVAAAAVAAGQGLDAAPYRRW